MAAKTTPPGGGELERYIASTPNSRKDFQEAQDYLPGGDSRNSIYYHPYPLFILRAEGPYVWDADGTRRLDFFNNMTTTVLGHGDPQVKEALKAQLEKGVGFGAPSEHQVHLARLLCERVPSIQRVRFTNSGTEATLNTVKAARAFTGREKIAKCEGGYHGSYDGLEVSIRPPLSEAGHPKHPSQVPAITGLPRSTLWNVVVLPYNDAPAARNIILEHSQELAAVIVEPLLGTSGMIPADREFLQMLREVTQENSILLIFDEVMSFRVAPGGAQEHYQVFPDLTVLGKLIGGGLPIGAFGGRAEIMDLFNPHREGGPDIPHSGSFNANPLTMVSGLATLQQLTPKAYSRLNMLGEHLRQGIRDILSSSEVPAQVTGLGSLFAIHLTSKPIRSYREVAQVDKRLRHEVFLGLLNEGFMLSPMLLGCLSTPMGEGEISQFLNALERVVRRVRQ